MMIKATIKEGRLAVAGIEGADPDTVMQEAMRYAHLYYEDFMSSDAKTFTIKLEKTK